MVRALDFSATAQPQGARRAALTFDEPNAKFGGAAMNATAGANETLYSIAGAPVDIVRGAMNLGVRGVNAATGANIPTIPENSFGGSRFIAETMGGIRPELDPSNTEATTAAERVARGTGQGVAGTILPAAIVGGLARTGTLGAQGADTAARIAGRSNSVRAAGADMVAGAAGGAGASAAMELTPDKYDPLSGLAGGIVGGGRGALATGIPGLARETARATRDFVAPLTQGGRERMAGQQINDAASDPAALREALANELSPLVPGSKPTTGQATGDMGVLALERAAQSRDPAAFQQRRADQNVARREVLDTLQPTGAAENVNAGSHAHSGRTDEAGAHSHLIGTAGLASSGGNLLAVRSELDNPVGSSLAGAHVHGVTIDAAGLHNHPISADGSHTHPITIDATGGTETRPRFIALLICIKA